MASTPVPVKSSTLAPTASPDVWRSFRTEMDRLFDRFTAGFGLPSMPEFRFASSAGIQLPAVDIAEDATSYKLTAELPGLTEKEIDISLSGDRLTIKGEKRQERDETKQDYHVSERSYGEFQRSFMLPDGVDPAKVAAVFANGVLTVTVPKLAQAAPTKIEVKAAA